MVNQGFLVEEYALERVLNVYDIQNSDLSYKKLNLKNLDNKNLDIKKFNANKSITRIWLAKS